MPLTQAEADVLLRMAKVFAVADELEFSQTQPMRYARVLLSDDRREEFLLDIERGRRNRARLRYQTRARRVVILARLDLDGPAHVNPPDAPHRPGERLDCPHLHRFVEGFEDRVAYPIGEAPGLQIRDPKDGVSCLEDFMRYCGISTWPVIQFSL